MRILLLPALILMCLGVEFSVLFAQSGQSAFNLGQHVNGYFIGFWGVFAATILTMTYRVMETRRDTIYVFMMGAAAFGVLTTLYILFGVMSSGNTLTESFLDTLTRALPFLFGSEIEPIIVDQLVLLDVFDVFSVNWSPSLFIADAGFAAMLHGVGVVLAYRWLAKPSAAYIGPPPLGNRTAPRGIITALISPMLGWLAIGLMVFNLSYVAAANWFIDTAPEVDLSSVISPKELADEVARFNDMRLMIEMIEESAPKDYELPELITALTNEISENFGEIGFIQTEGPSEQSNTSALPGRGEISFLFDTNFDLITRLEQLVSEEVSALALFRVTPSEQSTAD